MPLPEIRYIGENRLSKVQMYPDLESGQTVSAVTWSFEAGSGVTLVGGSNDVVNGPEGVASVVRGRFDFAAANVGVWTATAICACANPTETKIGFAILDVRALLT